MPPDRQRPGSPSRPAEEEASQPRAQAFAGTIHTEERKTTGPGAAAPPSEPRVTAEVPAEGGAYLTAAQPQWSETLKEVAVTGTKESKPPQTAPGTSIVAREVPLVAKAIVREALMTPVGSAMARPITPLRVVSHKAAAPASLDKRLILARTPDSPRASGFRVLRHRLHNMGDPRVIVVTSADRFEGKTTCAINLALALGECGRARVLLLEANLRFPSLAVLFGFAPPECFARQLASHRERPHEPWTVVEVLAPSTVHVAAVNPQNGGKPLLDGPAFALAIGRLRAAGYDYVVLDGPSVLNSAEVNLIQDLADTTLVTAWTGRSSARTTRLALDQLSPGKIAGIVLIEDPGKRDES